MKSLQDTLSGISWYLQSGRDELAVSCLKLYFKNGCAFNIKLWYLANNHIQSFWSTSHKFLTSSLICFELIDFNHIEFQQNADISSWRAGGAPTNCNLVQFLFKSWPDPDCEIILFKIFCVWRRTLICTLVQCYMNIRLPDNFTQLTICLDRVIWELFKKPNQPTLSNLKRQLHPKSCD
jgi:hypothetical protein